MGSADFLNCAPLHLTIGWSEAPIFLILKNNENPPKNIYQSFPNYVTLRLVFEKKGMLCPKNGVEVLWFYRQPQPGGFQVCLVNI